MLIEISRLDAGRLEPDITVFPLNEVFERLKVEFAPLAREKGPRSAHRCHARRGCARTGGCCAACCRTSLSNAIKYTATGKVLLGVRRRGDRLGDPRLRYRPRHPQVEAHAHLQGIPAPGGDGEHGAGPRPRAVDRRAHRQGARPPHRPAVGAGPRLDLLGRAAAGRSQSRPPSPATTVAPSVGRMAGLAVLCIDNEPAVLRGMQTLLEGWGCSVVTAQSAAEALAPAAARAALRPDIILADYHLDDGTGLEAVAALRAAARSQAPVIVITADHSAEVQREVRLRGYALLRKPLKAAALRALMYQLTWQRAVAAE